MANEVTLQMAILQGGTNSRLGEIEKDREIKENESEPPSTKDNVGSSRRECLVEDGLRPGRYQTLAARVGFNDLVASGLRYISPRRSHYSSLRPAGATTVA